MDEGRLNAEEYILRLKQFQVTNLYGLSLQQIQGVKNIRFKTRHIDYLAEVSKFTRIFLLQENNLGKN